MQYSRGSGEPRDRPHLHTGQTVYKRILSSTGSLLVQDEELASRSLYAGHRQLSEERWIGIESGSYLRACATWSDSKWRPSPQLSRTALGGPGLLLLVLRSWGREESDAHVR